MISSHPLISVRRQCELLGVHRSGIYYTPAPVPAMELDLRALLDRIYTSHPEYGVRRMQLALAEAGFQAGTDIIRRVMRDMGIEAIYPKPRLSLPGDNPRRFPYLLRNLDICRPHQVWAADLTYIALKQGWAYLVAIIDWFSRYVLAWDLSVTRDAAFAAGVYEHALLVAGQAPGIMNTDQGSEFTSSDWVGLVLGSGALVSQDGRGRALDNRIIERLWWSVKHEKIYLESPETPDDARRLLDAYFPYYNNERWHQSLDNRTPHTVLSGTHRNETGGV